MKYLVVTMPGDTDEESVPEVRKTLEGMMPGVKVVLIIGATSATLVEVERAAD